MFCAECGTQFEGNFCPKCGTRAGYTRMSQPITGTYNKPFVGQKDITGIEYEALCSRYIISLGYSNIETTKQSGDQGVDIIAYKNGYKYAIQCKYYSSTVGNSAIQEVVAGASFYNCQKKIVITNSTFTQGAIKLAESNDVILMPGITTEVINSSFNFRRGNINIREAYSQYRHSLPKKEFYYAFVNNGKLEKQYKEKITLLERYFRYFRKKDLEKYRPTNSYNSSSRRLTFWVDDDFNKMLESFVIILLEAFLNDRLHAVSTRLHKEDNNSFEVYFRKQGRVPIDQLQLDCIQAHLNSASTRCVYILESVDEYNFKIIISLRKMKIDTVEERKKYQQLEIDYYENLLKGVKIVHYTDANLSKKWFSQLEKEVFESVGYNLNISHIRITADYILDPIRLFNVEYNPLTGSITFLYYCQLDFRYFLDRKYDIYTKDIPVADRDKCILQISAKMFINEYSILVDDVFMPRPLNPSRIKKEITNLNTMIANHPFTPRENILLMHPYDFIVEKGLNWDS